MRLENWMPALWTGAKTPETEGKEEVCLFGCIYGDHRGRPDGRRITTSPVASYDGKRVTTVTGSVYELGKRYTGDPQRWYESVPMSDEDANATIRLLFISPIVPRELPEPEGGTNAAA